MVPKVYLWGYSRLWGFVRVLQGVCCGFFVGRIKRLDKVLPRFLKDFIWFCRGSRRVAETGFSGFFGHACG